MLVLVLLMLLLALAVPFVFTMAQQEGTAAGALNGEEARNLARSGSDHALARLRQGNRLNEYGIWYAKLPSDVSSVDGSTHTPPYPQWRPPIYDDPYVDGVLEYNTDIAAELYDDRDLRNDLYRLRDRNGAKIWDLENSLSQVLGVNTRDESGKINLNAATPELIGNLLGSGLVTEESIPNGSVYEKLSLDDASWIGDCDDKAGAGGLFGGGYVVVDGRLLSYESRLRNTLYTLTADPNYDGIGGSALFRAANSGWTIPVGASATSIQAYKLAYYPVLASTDGRNLASFNNLGEARNIAAMEWMPRSRFAGYFEGLNPVKYQNLLMDATTVAPTLRFDGRWFYAHVVERALVASEGETGKSSNFIQLNFDNVVQPDFYVQGDPRNPFKNRKDTIARSIGPGQIIRILHHNGATSLGVTLAGNRQGALSVMTSSPVTYQNNEPVTLEVAERATVNINSASYPVLVACLKGLKPRGQSNPMAVSAMTAGRIAELILGRTQYNPMRPTDYSPFRDLNEFSAFLNSLLADPNDTTGTKFLLQEERDSIMFMQQYPYSPQPCITAQFSFASLDAYAVESLASRFAPNGNRIAQSRCKEWVLLGSDSQQRYHWSLWDQFAAEQRAPQGNIMTLYPSGTVNDRNTGVIELPYIHYSNSERWVRGRFAPPFNNRPMDVAALAPDNGNPAEDFFANQTSGRGDLLPGAFSFWYRPNFSADLSTHYLFDSAESDYSNRISMLWWGNRARGYKLANKNSGLVFRIKDRTLEAAFTELRYELDPSMFRPGEWYHFTLNWKGTELSQLELLVDGDSRTGAPSNATIPQVTPVTNHTFLANNGAWVSRTTTLMDDLEFVDLVNNPSTALQTTIDLRIDPQDHGAMPSYGVIRIGDESIEYSGKDTYQLLMGIRRGARGTVPRFHPRGSQITVWGYTHPLDQWTRTQSNPVELVPQFPHLPATTGMLRSAHGDRSFWRVFKQGSANPAYHQAPSLGLDAGFPGADNPTAAQFLPLADYVGVPERGVMAVIGFAWDRYKSGVSPTGLLYPDFDPPATAGGFDAADTFENPPRRDDLEMEYIYYDGISANGLNVRARYDAQFQPKAANQYLHFLGGYDPVAMGWLAPPLDVVNNGQHRLMEFFRQGSVAIPCTLDVSSSGGYHDVSYVQVDDEWFFYNRRFPDPADANAPGAQLLAFIDDQPCKGPQGQWLPVNRIAQWVQQQWNNLAQNPVPVSVFTHFRAQVGSAYATHAASTPVTPVFCVARLGPPAPPGLNQNIIWPEPPTGRGDVITLVKDVNADKELHTLRNQRNVLWDHDGDPLTLPMIVYLGALVNHTLTDFRTSDPTNLCKFPTGDLPVEIPTAWTFAGAHPNSSEAGGGTNPGIGPHTGDFDSFEFRSYAKGLFRIEMPLTDTQPGEGQDIQVNGVNGLPPNVGIFHVDDELIAYRGTDTRQTTVLNAQGQTVTITTYWLTDITRGVIGSLPAAHAQGSGIMNMASLRLARPVSASGWTPLDSRLQVLPGEQALRDFGFVRIYEGLNQEVVGYQKYNLTAGQIQQGEIIAGRYDPRTFQGPFRGAYGSLARNFSSRALVLDQPVRFPDWAPSYCEQGEANFQRGPGDGSAGLPIANSPEVSHMQGSATFRNSEFEDLRWRLSFNPLANLLVHADSINARLVVRFDGQGEWGSVPTNRPGGLYSYDFNLNGANTLDLGSGIYEQTENFWRPNETRRRFDRIEWRVYFLFLPGAFDREDYKISLQFHGCDVGLRQVTRVVRHEEQR